MRLPQIRYNANACARGLLLFALTLVAVSAVAQEEGAPKVDVFAGYQYLNPAGDVPVPNTSSPVQAQTLVDFRHGFGLAGAYNFNRYLGLEADYGGDWKDGFSVNTLSFGPRLMLRTDGANFFLHGLFGENRLGTPFGSGSGFGAILGGGIDLRLWNHFDWRVFEADYQWSKHDFSAVPSSQPDLRSSRFDGLRMRTGVVLEFGGGAPPVPPSATCSAQPSQVMVGEPVTVTATPSNFNLKHSLSYDWSSNAGKISGKDTTATIDTNGVAGGNYTATAKITDARAKKNGMASCSANFTVKEPPKNPPTISCSANPSTVPAGGTVSLSCTCTSPDSVPVTVANWTTTSGDISGNGNMATLTAGPNPANVTVSAVCTDTRGLNTTANTLVTVEMPPPPLPPPGPTVQELEIRLALHSVYFPTAQPTPQKPEIGLLESQQRTLSALAADFQLYLQHKPDAHLILEGHADPRGSAPYNQALSERRVDLTKSFLVNHGVPAADIETKAFGLQKNLTATQVKDLVDTNPQVTPEQRQKILKNMRTILLASNRRVDVTLSTTGQQSVKQYPFNAADSLTLLEQKAGAAKTKPAPKKKK
jgi:outer membrane protein OmpA-like peptidoglycan-associated protein